MLKIVFKCIIQHLKATLQCTANNSFFYSHYCMFYSPVLLCFTFCCTVSNYKLYISNVLQPQYSSMAVVYFPDELKVTFIYFQVYRIDFRLWRKQSIENDCIAVNICCIDVNIFRVVITEKSKIVDHTQPYLNKIVKYWDIE